MIQPEKDYLRFLQEGHFMILHSRSTGGYVFYPRVIEPRTGVTDLEWVPAIGTGTVYSVTVIRKRTLEESYNVVLIDLDEGPRMMSRVDGMPFEQIKIGMRVKARIVQENDQAVVVFVSTENKAQPAGAST
ncbi:Zn-ribbon domain-containing OB-fold protein [Glaciimonas sp. GNP009]